MDPKFYNKDGSLNRYALSCGYVEKKGSAQLYREHACYHVLVMVDGKAVREDTWSLKEVRKHLTRLSKMKDTKS